MRLLADLENQYWRKHFAHRPYYVAGRSYDQYQPAYELGWLHAVQHPLSSFDTLEAHLAQQWSSQRTTSLLSWKEARSAVQDGWRHALQQQHAWQQPAAPASSLTPEMARMLKSLYRHGLHLSGELTRLAQMRVSDFVTEVVNQHARMLRDFSRSLAKLPVVRRTSQSLSHRLVHKMRRHWSSMQSHLLEADPESLLLECEQKSMSCCRPTSVLASTRYQSMCITSCSSKACSCDSNWKNSVWRAAFGTSEHRKSECCSPQNLLYIEQSSHRPCTTSNSTIACMHGQHMLAQ